MKFLIFAAIIAAVTAEAHWDESGQYRILEDGKVPVKVEVVDASSALKVEVVDGSVLQYPYKIAVEPVWPGLYPYPLVAKAWQYPIVAKLESPFRYSYKQINSE